ncbi:19048_t:CDS:2 [Gigaspora rosea]|nr:19048_t:CDS:2 [Gigaspora rosea]
MSILYQINADGSIGLPFGCAIETYILSLPIVKGAGFKCQSQQKLNQAIQKILLFSNMKKLELTENGQSYVNQIQQGLVSDLCVWYWVFYCAGDKNCQRACGGFGECVLNCPNYQMKNNLKYGNDMHKCKVCIITKVMLSMVKERFPIKLYIEDGCTVKEIKLKLLTPFNGILREQLEQQEKYRINYDLNNNRAPVHTIVVEDGGNWGTPIGFALSNKENMHIIRLAVEAIKVNIPCKDINCNHPYEYIALPNNKGFKRIQPCAIEWKPFAMMDRHRPTKAALKPIIRSTILCWFHIMQSFRNHFRTQKIDWSLRYPIALDFKIIGKCRSITDAKEMAIKYKNFISSLPISTKAKMFFIHNLEDNWLCQEWILSFIDGGHLPSQEDGPYTKPWTTNNFTERINKTIEERYLGTQTVLTFIERLYGIKFARSSLTDNCGQLVFNANELVLISLAWIIRDFRKHGHAASPSMKNKIIYTGSDEESYADILRQYRMKGDAIFFPTENKVTENDPFKPKISWEQFNETSEYPLIRKFPNERLHFHPNSNI